MTDAAIADPHTSADGVSGCRTIKNVCPASPQRGHLVAVGVAGVGLVIVMWELVSCWGAYPLP